MLTDAKIAAIKPPKEGQQEYPDHKVTGLRLRVGAGGKKTWTVRRRVGDKIVNRKIGTYPAMKLAAARSAAEAMIEALETTGSTEAIDRTFGQVADHWIKNVAKPKNKSWQLQERRLEMHVLPSWRDRKIATIKRADVRELIGGLEGDVLPNRVLTTIKTVFRHALSQDWLEASPVEGIKKPKDETERDRVLDMGEIARIWSAALLLGYPMGQYVRMLLLTAQRRSEVAAMRWADVDREGATWTLRAAGTKSERATLVPLSAPAMGILDDAPEIGPFVFTTDGETCIANFAKAKAKLDEYIAAKGEALAPWTLHDLRRSAANHMVRLGVSVEVVGRVLNHAATGVTRRVYALHDFAPEKRLALDKWAAEVDRAISGKSGKVVKFRG